MHLACLRRVGWTLGSVGALVLGCSAQTTEEEEDRCDVPGYGAIGLADVTAGEGGFVVDAEGVLDGSFYAAAAAGDVNGDGLDDVAMGAPRAGPDYFGRAYVVFGKADTHAVALSSVVEGEGGFVLDAQGQDTWTGYPLSGAGDVNGDGLADVIVGSDFHFFVVLGKEDTEPVPLTEVAQGSGGFLVHAGADREIDIDAVGEVGDMNGDGLDDIIVGATYSPANDGRKGRAFVVAGKTDTEPVLLPEVAEGVGGFVLEGDWDPWSVSGAGDVNGDGVVDVIVSLRHEESDGEWSSRAYVVFGKADAEAVVLSEVAAGTGGFVLDGEAAGDDLGMRVAEAGDVNGDGLADVIVGASAADPNGENSGRVYVVFGKAGTEAVVLSDVAAGNGGFILDGRARGDGAGRSVGWAGDINGDGLDDVVVGAHGAHTKDGARGRTYLVFGKTDTEPVALTDVAAGGEGFVLDGEPGAAFTGSSSVGAGDVNGDGVPDIVVGGQGTMWPQGMPAGRDSDDPDIPGRAYVFFGGDFSCPVEETGSSDGR